MTRYLIVAMLSVLLLTSCGSKTKDIPQVQLKEVKIKDLAPPVDSYVLEPPQEKNKIPLGSSQGQAAPIIASNGAIEQENINKLRLAQQYIKNLFK